MSSGPSIVATFGGDVSGLRKSGDDAVNAVDHIATQIAKKFEFRDVGRALATSLGLNLESIAENVARLFTGMSKEQEEAYKSIGAISDQVTAAIIANNRARLTDEQKYQLALLDEERIRTSIENNVGRTVEQQLKLQQDKLALINAENASKTLQAKIEDDAAKQVTENVEHERKLREDLADAWKKWDEDAARRQKELAASIQSDVQKSADLTDQIHEQKIQQLPIEDQLVAREKDIAELLAEQKAVVKDSNDYKELQIQITDKLNDVATLGLQIAQKKAAVEAAAAAAAAKAAQEAAAREAFAGNFSSTGRADSDLSDRELQAKIDAANKDIDARKAAQLYDGANVGNPGTGWDGGNYDPLLNIEKTSLQGALAQLDLRQQVRQQASILGPDAAANNFGLTDSQLASILGTATDSSQVVDQLKQLNANLKNGTLRISTLPLT